MVYTLISSGPLEVVRMTLSRGASGRMAVPLPVAAC